MTARHVIKVFIHFWSSDRLVLRRLQGMAALDPELDEVLSTPAMRGGATARALLGLPGD